MISLPPLACHLSEFLIKLTLLLRALVGAYFLTPSQTDSPLSHITRRA